MTRRTLPRYEVDNRHLEELLTERDAEVEALRRELNRLRALRGSQSLQSPVTPA